MQCAIVIVLFLSLPIEQECLNSTDLSPQCCNVVTHIAYMHTHIQGGPKIGTPDLFCSITLICTPSTPILTKILSLLQQEIHGA